MSDPPKLRDLHSETKRNRLDLLQTDLALCSTFVDLAATELEIMGDQEAALKVHAKAEEGYATVSRFLSDVDDGAEKQDIQDKLSELRAKLEDSRLRLYP